MHARIFVLRLTVVFVTIFTAIMGTAVCYGWNSAVNSQVSSDLLEIECLAGLLRQWGFIWIDVHVDDSVWPFFYGFFDSVGDRDAVRDIIEEEVDDFLTETYGSLVAGTDSVGIIVFNGSNSSPNTISLSISIDLENVSRRIEKDTYEVDCRWRRLCINKSVTLNGLTWNLADTFNLSAFNPPLEEWAPCLNDKGLTLTVGNTNMKIMVLHEGNILSYNRDTLTFCQYIRSNPNPLYVQAAWVLIIILIVIPMLVLAVYFKFKRGKTRMQSPQMVCEDSKRCLSCTEFGVKI